MQPPNAMHTQTRITPPRNQTDLEIQPLPPFSFLPFPFPQIFFYAEAALTRSSTTALLGVKSVSTTTFSLPATVTTRNHSGAISAANRRTQAAPSSRDRGRRSESRSLASTADSGKEARFWPAAAAVLSMAKTAATSGARVRADRRARAAGEGAGAAAAGQKRASFPLSAVLAKLRDSLRLPLSREEGAACVRLLAAEIAPEWLRVVTVAGSEIVVVLTDFTPSKAVVEDRVRLLLHRKRFGEM